MSEVRKSKESIAYRGRIGEVVELTQPDGRVFEQYRRPPGTRLVAVSPENKILVSCEFRHETGGYDLRLPGGKVCDTLEAYDALRESGADMVEAARHGMIKEAGEEAGLDIHSLDLITVAKAGATVDWDLYYWLTRDFSQRADGQALEEGEDITTVWMSPDEIRGAIADGKMAEWRSVGVLLGMVLPDLEKVA